MIKYIVRKMRRSINTIISLAFSLAIVLGPQQNVANYGTYLTQSNVIVQPQNQINYQINTVPNDKPVTNSQYDLPTKANYDAGVDASRIRHNSISKGTIYTVVPTQDYVTGPGMFINQ